MLQRGRMHARLGPLLVAAGLVMSACGGAGAPAPGSKGTVVVASTNFTENVTLAYLYAKVLEPAGYKTELRLNLGSREIVEPALEKGEIDVVPEYISTLLEFLNKGANEASADTTETLGKLRPRLEAAGLRALDPAPAQDHSAFVVRKETADKHRLRTMSDLARVSKDLVLGASPQCPQRPFCLPGLKRVYGIDFRDFKATDAVGPITRTALERGDVDVALLTSTDGAIAAKGWVALDDDKGLQRAENVTPVIRTKAATADIERALNGLSAKLTTDDLIQLNKAVTIDKEDAAVAAERWLKDKGLIKK